MYILYVNKRRSKAFFCFNEWKLYNIFKQPLLSTDFISVKFTNENMNVYFYVVYIPYQYFPVYY